MLPPDSQGGAEQGDREGWGFAHLYPFIGVLPPDEFSSVGPLRAQIEASSFPEHRGGWDRFHRGSLEIHRNPTTFGR